jgi:hypothetical protein
MQAEDSSESRLDRIETFLAANGATVFARLLDSIPLLARTIRDNKLTMIFAPSNVRLQSWATSLNKSIRELLETTVGRDLMANHLRIQSLNQVYPIYTAVNGVAYGQTVANIQALSPTAKIIMDGVFVAVIPRIIIDVDQTKTLEGLSTAGNLEKMTYDTFQSIVLTGGLRGRDLLNFCDSTEDVKERLCQHRDRTGRTIFHYLLKQEFNIDLPVNSSSNDNKNEDDARFEYSRRYPKDFPTTAVIKTLSRRLYEMSKTKSNASPPRMIMYIKNGISISSLTTDQLLDVLWKHPIDPVYFLIVVYPKAGSSEYRVVAWKLNKSRYGRVFSDDGTRFELNSDNFTWTSGEAIGPDENPLKKVVLEYRHAYPEVLPFLYNEELRRYDKVELSKLINGLFAIDSTPAELMGNPQNIVDLYPDVMNRQTFDRSVAMSLSRLGSELIASRGQPLNRLDTPNLMEPRFKYAYSRITKDALEEIIHLILIVSNAALRA